MLKRDSDFLQDHMDDGGRREQLRFDGSLLGADGMARKKPRKTTRRSGSLQQPFPTDSLTDKARPDTTSPVDYIGLQETDGNGTYDFRQRDEMLIPGMDDVHQDVLLTLPPSAQMDMLIKIREQRVAENRSHFQTLSGKIEDFSELQMNSYLKSSNIRQQMEAATVSANVRCMSDAIKESAGFRTDGTYRMKKNCIASTVNREYLLTEPDKIVAQNRAHLPRVCKEIHADSVTGLERAGLSKWRQNHGTFQNDEEKVAIRSCGVHLDDMHFPATETAPPGASIPHILAKIPGKQLRANKNSATLDFTFESLDAASGGIDPLFEGESKRAHLSTQNTFQDTFSSAHGGGGNVTYRLLEDDGNIPKGSSACEIEQFWRPINESELPLDHPPRCLKHRNNLNEISSFELTEEENAQGWQSRDVFLGDKIPVHAPTSQDRITMTSSAKDPVSFFESKSKVKPVSEVADDEQVICDAQLSGKTKTGKSAKHMLSGGNASYYSQPIVAHTSDDIFHLSAEIPVQVSIFLRNEDEAIEFRSIDTFEVELTRALDRCTSLLTRVVFGEAGAVVKCQGFRFDTSAPIANSFGKIIIACHRVTGMYPTQFKMMRKEHGKSCCNQLHTVIPDCASNSCSDLLVDMFVRDAKAERKQLQIDKRNAERGADAPSEGMYRQIQELLSLFGIPYVIAPQEAEAQCAWLNSEGLVDAVITDDSDAFLFGAKTIYRHVFQSKKYVEVYSADGIQHDLGIDRAKMAELALLLGSDYTEGISGVGIVNALEIVTSFPGLNGLKEFRDWAENQDLSDHAVSTPNLEETTPRRQRLINGLTKPEKHRKMGRVIEQHLYMCDKNGWMECAEITSRRQSFKRGHQTMKRSWRIPDDFPSSAVLEAYEKPAVDRSREPLLWGKPNLNLLRAFCCNQFHWQHTKIDELILPVLALWKKVAQQSRIDNFFSAADNTNVCTQQFAKYRSARIQKAVADLTRKSLK